ncbi:MAG: metalloregulator ArsR/SmtB family transcription factor [Candidatus Margulisbacteria bacterium]|nr:metalloregulator ArsR/SmtB family transcription factor [Candidatus Margulisiibacteriota bacterium]MBU1729601.1 metalloregulator ArsR/SmtB family transcription factor [Candidatus Margulisiibacteriota bacterium]MBU1956026.1 metalloregulator ArsR/SmtB family transcription factor [Candidatus Margulisiibacteriota bacterium]
MNIVKEKELAKIFRALSEKTRLKIIKLLSNGERCVCELFQALDLPQPKVSRHLAYLKKVGLVKSRKEGLWQHYSLNMKLVKLLALDKILYLKFKKAKKCKSC